VGGERTARATDTRMEDVRRGGGRREQGRSCDEWTAPFRVWVN